MKKKYKVIPIPMLPSSMLLEKCFYEAGTKLFLGPGTRRRLMFPVTLADILELNKDTALAGLSLI
jgi:hypothetical protein